MIITIDGPSGSGKSTIAQRIAQQLGIFYLNTGALYRTIAYLVFEEPSSQFFKKYDVATDEITLGYLATQPSIDYAYSAAGATIRIAGTDITPHLYATPNIDQNASRLSALPAVRTYLLDVQRAIARQHSVIADGRDCGTVVFPQAEHKFFLTASLDARAKRRMLDPKAIALGLSFDQVKADIAARDERDQTRTAAPLRIPEGAAIIDSSNLTVEQVIGEILRIVQ